MNSPSYTETTFAFDCEGESLAAVLHLPIVPRDVGVVIVVGGPQYRVGSHRQFLLLARALAAHDYAVLRFDYRGLGDSGGELRGFEFANEDIGAALDEMQRRVPVIRRFVLWGLCDAATAASFYAPRDSRVAGLVLLNPWIRSEATLARSLLFHYYRDRLLDVNAWRKLLANPTAIKKALSSLKRIVGTAFGKDVADQSMQPEVTVVTTDAGKKGPLLPRFTAALTAHAKPILLILSGADITANEFVEGMRATRRLHRRLQAKNVTQRNLATADHTFSRAQWRDHVADWTREWLDREFSKSR